MSIDHYAKFISEQARIAKLDQPEPLDELFGLGGPKWSFDKDQSHRVLKVGGRGEAPQQAYDRRRGTEPGKDVHKYSAGKTTSATVETHDNASPHHIEVTHEGITKRFSVKDGKVNSGGLRVMPEHKAHLRLAQSVLKAHNENIKTTHVLSTR